MGVIMKNIIHTILTATLFLSVTASAQTKVTMWHWWGEKGQFYDEMAKRFEAENPDVDIEVNNITHGAYPEQLRLAFLSDNVPDIFGANPDGGARGYITYLTAGKVETMTQIYQDYGWNERFYPSAIKQLTYKNGDIYTVPLSVNNLNFYYNKKLFAENNVPIPTDYESFNQAVEIFKKKGIPPIAWGNKGKWTGKDIYLGVVGQLNPNALDKPNNYEADFSDPVFMEALDIIQNMIEQGYFAGGINGMGDFDARQMFYSGRAAMHFSGTWLMPEFLMLPPENFEIGVFATPNFTTKSNKTSPGGVGMNVAVYKDSPNKKIAYQFLDFITKTENQQYLVEAFNLTSPVAQANMQAEDISPMLKVFNKTQATATPRVFLSPAVEKALGEAIQDLIKGKIKPENIIKEMNKAQKRDEKRLNR